MQFFLLLFFAHRLYFHRFYKLLLPFLHVCWPVCAVKLQILAQLYEIQAAKKTASQGEAIESSKESRTQTAKGAFIMLFTIISIAVIFANMYFTQSALPCEPTAPAEIRLPLTSNFTHISTSPSSCLLSSAAPFFYMLVAKLQFADKRKRTVVPKSYESSSLWLKLSLQKSKRVMHAPLWHLQNKCY